MRLLVTLGVTGIASLGALAAFVVAPGASPRPAPAPAVVEIVPPAVITQRYSSAQYEALTDGMSYDDAARALGHPGQHATKASMAEIGGDALKPKTMTFVWRNPDRSSVLLVFNEEDQLVQRAYLAARAEPAPAKPHK